MQDIMEVRGKVEVPYEWTYGSYVGRFFKELKENKQFWGIKCPKCLSVLCPPPKICGKCFVEATEWVKVSDVGTLQTFTVVQLPFPGQPTEPPYAYGYIILDGANTPLPHLIGEISFDKITMGMRVKAVWNEERKGDLYDIKYFKPCE